MIAAFYTKQGHARDVLLLDDLNTPVPGPGEVRVKVCVSGVNPADVKRRAGAVSRPMVWPIVIPHSDGAGVIDAVGHGVPSSREGERVWMWNAQWGRPFGTAAQYVTLPAEHAVPLPAQASSVVIKLAYGAGSDAEALLALRMAIALPIYIGIWLLNQRGAHASGVSLNGALLAASVGVLGYGLFSYLDLKGLEYISAPVERLILFTYPFFVAVFGALLFGIAIKRAAITGLVVSYAGLLIVLLDSLGGALRLELLGIALVFGSAATFALFQLLAGRAVRVVGAVHFTCISMSAASAGSIAMFLAHRPVAELASSTQVLGLAALLAIVGTVFPTFALSAALKRISAQANSAIGSVSPVITTLLCVWLLGDTLSVRSALGGVLVIAGAVWFTSRDARE